MQQYQAKVQFIHINIDSPDAQAALKRYNVRGTPTIVLFDRNGRVVSNLPGWSGDQAVANALDTLVAEP
jgi:thioredoxin-related protein